MNKVIKKKYCKIRFVLESPLALSSGENIITDKDLAKDSSGRPYIPGTSIAGVVQEALVLLGESPKSMESYFGFVTINTNSSGNADPDDAKSSKIIFYDAFLDSNDSHISVRDSVSLDEYKTAKKGAKLDMEVLEAGCFFSTFVEQSFESDEETDYIDKIAALFQNGLQFGGKTSRGYGAVKACEIKKKEFCFSSGDAVVAKEWISWLGKDEEARWKTIQPESIPCSENVPSATDWTLAISLKQVGGISVRRYTTVVGDKGNAQPDMEQLTSHVLKNGKEDILPVIPGTSWAGAFSHRMKELGLSDKEIQEVFGSADEKDKARSQLILGESCIEGAKEKILSRNSIDRFSGGTVDGALFTEKTYYNGNTILMISWKGRFGENNERLTMKDPARKALAAALTDLHLGLLSVGGETSIGRGIFKITEINGEKQIDGKNIESLCSLDCSEPERDGERLFKYLLQQIPANPAEKAGEQ